MNRSVLQHLGVDLPLLLELTAHNLDLAISHSAIDWIGLLRRAAFTKDLSVGVLDVHSHVVESAETVQKRIERALTVVPAEALWVTPDCGLKTRTVDEATANLHAMVEAIVGVRAARSTHPEVRAR